MAPVKQHMPADEVQRALRTGKRYASTSFFVRVLRTSVSSVVVGVVVSARVAPKATKRNYIKRILRHAARETISENAGGYDIVFTAKKEINKVAFGALLKEVAFILKQASVPVRTP
jgi:ribonuclease P protein component